MGDGAEGIHIREIVCALRALGHDVEVTALAGDPTQPAVAKSARVRGLRKFIPAFGYEIAELAYNEVGYRQLCAAIDRFRPDVIYDRYNCYSTAALRAARRKALPLLLEVNAPVAYERSVYDHLPLKFPRLAQRYERRIFNEADRLIVVSTPLKHHVVGTAGTDPEKIVILPNGANPDVFRPCDGEPIRRRYGLGDRLVVGFVGILRPWHGVDLLLRAFRQLRDQRLPVHLLIVGDGPIEDQLRSEAHQLGLATDVTITGRVTHTDVVGHVAAMDVCVSPHATFYASPMKLVEYMAMQKAVVAPAMDNIRDLVEADRTGLLFEPQDSDALAAAIGRVLTDAQLRSDLARRARRSVITRFNWRHNAEQLVESAQSLLSKSTRSRATRLV
jgi:glycosyltransferase involved in cell wall biosynthesis